jgi:hypothetical protein
MATRLEISTQDDGEVYLAPSRGARGEFLLSVTDRYRPEVTGQDQAEVVLTRSDLLRFVEVAAKLLNEAE